MERTSHSTQIEALVQNSEEYGLPLLLREIHALFSARFKQWRVQKHEIMCDIFSTEPMSLGFIPRIITFLLAFWLLLFLFFGLAKRKFKYWSLAQSLLCVCGFLKVFINVPWWYLAFYTMISPFMTQRTKSKFVFAGPSKTAETLYKWDLLAVICIELLHAHFYGHYF